ncbi:adhesion G-protein coupled receptor D1-like [Hydractinia symbiolongicarpus]|uniref:adhesion G-protein coupled receptor D1-like n=1 Tax=Hydractinia symbiolongicarpus TaxID=13093 RepID=UPI00254C5E50|nr:adhesion G-protein coupled receptor D1-like [Hydractinia symbiolongicarpus]
MTTHPLIKIYHKNGKIVFSLSRNGDWDDSGCKMHSKNGTLVTCQCNHMTSFSVLIQTEDVRISNKDKLALTMITYIGCGVSIVACIALIATFLMCGRLVKSDRNIIHINLAIAIGLGNTLFLFADFLHGHKYVCTGISIGMMFCYLSAFFWMLVEGIHVYQLVVKVFRVVKMMKIYLAIGWGKSKPTLESGQQHFSTLRCTVFLSIYLVCPAIIVAVTASTKHEYLTREDFCWISTSSDVIWTFVGPVLCVIVTNVVILIQTLRVSYKMTVATSEGLKFRKLAQLTLLLLPVFGLSWIFGILAVNDDVIIFQYVFAFLSAFQGLFIFVGYVILNSDVKREYDRVKRRSLNSSLKSHRSTDTLRSSTEEMRNRRKSSQFSLISMMSFRAKYSESMEFKLKCIESADDVFHVNTRI